MWSYGLHFTYISRNSYVFVFIIMFSRTRFILQERNLLVVTESNHGLIFLQ